MSSRWPVVPAAQVARIEIGGTPARDVRAFWADEETGNPWASIADLRSPILTRTTEYISDLGVGSSNVKLVPKGTPIMSFKLTVGRVSVAGIDLYTNEAIAAFHVDQRVIDPRFLVHVLPGAASSVVTDSAIKGATLNKKSLATISLVLPALNEQRRIAEILDTLDEQIRTTEQVVEKLRLVREGLMRELFRRGQWEQVALDDVVDASRPICYGILMPGPHMANGVPVIKVMNMKSGQIDVSNLLRTSPTIDFEYRRSRLLAGDVLLSIRGSVGRVSLVPTGLDGANITQDTARIAVRGGYGKYVAHFLGSLQAQRFIDAETVGLAVKGINLRDVRRIMIPLPPLSEAIKISDALDAADEAVRNEEELASKLKSTKIGMCSDLLTGRVRVPTRAGS